MIYYSHVNEDNRVERRLLQQGAFPTVVAICGSGERVLSLLDEKRCKKMVVVDCNEEAIFLLQLKLTALTSFSVQEYLQFIGHHPLDEKERLRQFEKLKQTLPADALRYWERNKKVVAKGVLDSGHFEKFLHRVRPFIRFHLGKDFQRLFTEGYREKSFPKHRWNLLKKVFAYKLVYQLAGNKDLAFVGAGANVPHIPEALDNAIKKNKAASSFMAHLVFNGTLLQMREEDLPPSLQESVLMTIRQRLVRKEIAITYHVANILDFLKDRPTKPPTFYSLSDILSFADFAYLEELIQQTAMEGNTVTGRSFLRNRLTATQVHRLESFGELQIHDQQESTGMYQAFSIHGKQPA